MSAKFAVFGMIMLLSASMVIKEAEVFKSLVSTEKSYAFPMTKVFSF